MSMKGNRLLSVGKKYKMYKRGEILCDVSEFFKQKKRLEPNGNILKSSKIFSIVREQIEVSNLKTLIFEINWRAICAIW